MRRWRPKDVIRLAHATRILTEEAINRALSDAHGGMPSGNGQGRTTANEDGTPVSRVQIAALAGKKDSVVETVHALIRALSDAHQAAASLCAVSSEDAKRMVTRPDASGHCVNCGAWVSNTPKDRIKSGRCMTCYQWRRRHGGEDRPKDVVSEDTHTR